MAGAVERTGAAGQPSFDAVSKGLSYLQPSVCIADVPLGRADAVLDNRRVIADSPQRSSYGQLRQEFGFNVGETEQAFCFWDLVGGLPEEDAGLGVSQQAHRNLCR